METHTGSIVLDKVLETGGLHRRRVVEIYGSESSEKTTLTIHNKILAPLPNRAAEPLAVRRPLWNVSAHPQDRRGRARHLSFLLLRACRSQGVHQRSPAGYGIHSEG